MVVLNAAGVVTAVEDTRCLRRSLHVTSRMGKVSGLGSYKTRPPLGTQRVLMWERLLNTGYRRSLTRRFCYARKPTRFSFFP